MGQNLLFGEPVKTAPAQPSGWEYQPIAQEKARLSRQCDAILNHLRAGRITNDELSKISRKYTSRVSEIRQAGNDVRVVEHNRKTGLAVYALFVDGLEVSS